MDQVKESHKAEYKKEAEVVVCAPGRFHLIGEHSWFAKDKTLSMAVNLPVYVALSRRDDTSVCFNYPQMKEKKKCSCSAVKFKKEDKWANVLKSVMSGFISLGCELGGMDITVWSENLPSAGFGISTAMKVAFAWAIRELFNFKLDDNKLILAIEKGSRTILQLTGSRADLFSAIYSKKGNLLVTDHSRNSWDLVKFPFKDKIIVLTDAKVPRIVTWNEESIRQPENILLLGELKEKKLSVYGGWVYQDKASEINEVLSLIPEEIRRRLSCIMNEHKYLLDAVSALENKDFSLFARSVKCSHENMRDGYDISCPEIDWIVKHVQDSDLNGKDVRNPLSCARITGKGFGRCVYTIIDSDKKELFEDKLKEYERIFGFVSESHTVEASDGVKIL